MARLGQIHMRIVMPGASGALLVPTERVVGMIMRSRDEADAREEHTDYCGYPTPFHSILHSYGAVAVLFKQNRPVTWVIGIIQRQLNSRGLDVPLR